MVTQKHIAEELGISQSAVACALNPALHRHISPNRRREILNVAQRLGYVPHHAARRLIRSRFQPRARRLDQVGLIAILEPSAEVDLVGLAMMSGAERELSKVHACLTFVRLSEESDWDKLARLTRAGILDAGLLYGAVNDDVVARLREITLPHVVLGDHRCTRPVPWVDVDNVGVGRMAVQHLASLGHRRIGFVNNPRNFPYQMKVASGFQSAVRELALDDDEQLIARCSHMESVRWLCEMNGPKPTALFTPEFDLAPYFYRMLRERDPETADRISILACEPASQSASVQGFTRIELPMSQVGQQGAVLLQRLVENSELSPDEIKVPAKLIAGWSTAAPGARRLDGQTRSTSNQPASSQ